MSSVVLASKGQKALDDKKYEEAIVHYTAAIKEAPTSPNFFIQRSIAHGRAKKYDEALEDADQAVINANARAKRELIVEAQFRRGLALHQLKRPADACYILDLVKKKDPNHSQAIMTFNMAHNALKKLSPEDDLAVVTVKETPDVSASKATAATTTGVTSTPATTIKGESTSTTVPKPQQTPVDKIRYDWYQNTEHVYFTLLAKGVPKDKAQIDIGLQSLSVDFPLLSGASYQLTLDPLFAAVKPEKCIVSVLPSKVEIILAKATAQKWSSLESSEPVGDVAMKDSTSEQDAVKRAVFADPTPGAPAYPTSSKSGPKDWDKIGADDEEEGSGDPNDFFKKIFAGASPEMQRAMTKSYTESNGTALSTNWDEVSKGKVETSPPDGMEAKSFEQ